MLLTPGRGGQNLKMFHKITRHAFVSTFSSTFLRIFQMAKVKLSPSSVNVYLFERLSEPNHPPPTVAMSLKHLTLYPWVCLLGWVSQPYYVKRSIFRIWPSSRVYSRQSRVHIYVVHCRWLFKAPWILKLHAATRKKHMPPPESRSLDRSLFISKRNRLWQSFSTRGQKKMITSRYQNKERMNK